MTTEFMRRRQRRLEAWRESHRGGQPLRVRVAILALLSWGAGVDLGSGSHLFGCLLTVFALLLWWGVSARLTEHSTN